MKKFELNDFRETTLNFFNNEKELEFIEDCLVQQRGLIYKDGNVIANTAIEHLIWLSGNLLDGPGYIGTDPRFHDYLRGNLILERLTGYSKVVQNVLDSDHNIVDLEGTSLHLMHPFWDYEYGHFFDTFQKILRLDNNIKIDNIILSNPKKVIDFNVHLECLGLDKYNKIRIQSGNTLLRCKKLIYIYPIACHTSFTPSSFNKIRSEYFSKLKINFEEREGLKLFLARPNNIPRHLINDEEVYGALKKLGVQVLYGTEPLAEIIEKFSRATHVAAVHGSLLANIIFCGEDTKYLEFCPSNRPDFSFYGKYKLSPHYTHKLINADSEHNISIDIDELKEFYN